MRQRQGEGAGWRRCIGLLRWLALLAAFAPALLQAGDRSDADAVRPGYLLDRWGTADGLPVEGITRVLIGADGYIWLATFGGLVRFDGDHFTTFDASADSALGNDRLTSLREDGEGRLWAVTESRALVSFSGLRFRNWGRADGLPSSDITLAPVLAHGSLWIGTSEGPATFDPTGRRWRPAASTVAVRAIAASDDGAVWVGTDDGLLRFDGAGAVVRYGTNEGLPGAHVVAIGTVEPEGAWIATASGVVRLADGVVQGVVGTYPDILRIERDQDGAIELVSPLIDYRIGENGIQASASRVGELRYPPGSPSMPDGSRWYSRRGVLWRNGERVLALPCAIDSLAADAAGAIWIASQCRGLQRVRRVAITSLSESGGRPLGAVYGLAQDAAGALWIASLDGSVSVMEGDGSTRRLGVEHGFGDMCLGSFLAEPDGTMWAGRTRVCRIADERCGPVADGPAALDPKRERSSGLLSADVRGLYRDRRGRLWAGSINGLWYRQRGAWTRVPEVADDVHVRTFAETADGSLWFGTTGHGLLRRTPEGRFLRHGRAEGLSSQLIRGMLVDRAGRLWVATENRGLCRNINDGVDFWRFACVGRSEGLWSDRLHQTLEDEQGNLWISSDAGLMRVARAALDEVIEQRAPRVYARLYTERDGLPSRELNGGVQGAGIVLADGRLAFATQAGVAFVDPRAATRGQNAMQAVIESVNLPDGRSFGVGSAKKLPIVLPRGERSITLHFTGLSADLSPSAYFQYRLLPEQTWTDIGSLRQLTLSHLAAGTQTIELLALNSTGQAGPPARLSLTLPAWPYETASFRYGAPALMLVVLVAWLRNRQRLARERERRLEAAVAGRTSELASALHRLNEQNGQIARLAETRTRYFLTVSHELRTPLSLIIGPLRDAARGEALKPRTMSTMVSSANRLERLVTELLDLERMDAGCFPLRPARHDLAVLLRGWVDAFAALAARRRIHLACRIGEAPCMARMDAEQMARAVGNLLSNALKFTPEGGCVDVALESAGRFLRLRFDDNGPGVPEAWRERIFDRFSQIGSEAVRDREGAGLGLVLCREIAMRHGGRVWVEERPGGGSRFLLEIAPEMGVRSDLVDAAPGRRTPPAASLPAPVAARPMPSRRVLVAEDHPELRAYVSGILQRDHEVVLAADGAEALAIARAQLPDLIVSDILMPNMDGRELAMALQRDDETAGIPLIFLTALASEADEIAGLASGAIQYLRKPFDAEVLRAHVGAALHTVDRLRRRFARTAARSVPPVIEADVDAAAASGTTRDAAFLARALAWIEQNLHDDTISVSSMAAALHVSRATLDRRLASAAGEAPGALLRRRRLERAADLLVRGEGSVSEVAYSVGYASLAAFSRAYREHHGKPPSGRERGRPGETFADRCAEQ